MPAKWRVALDAEIEKADRTFLRKMKIDPA